MITKQQIALQFANQLLASRLPIAAAETIGNASISDAATSRYRALMAVAPQAVALYRRQTAPPAIAADVVRQVNGRERSIKIVPAQADVPISAEEIDEMAKLLATHIQAAAAASVSADVLVLDQIP